MEKSKVIIIGASVFELTTAIELARKGYKNIIVLDRHIPPVPEGSSVDISRVIRFNCTDKALLEIAYDAYQQWSQSLKYRGIFNQTSFVLTSDDGSESTGHSYIRKMTTELTKKGLPWKEVVDTDAAKRLYPLLTICLGDSGFSGYHNRQAGCTDAEKAIAQPRDDCIEFGVSFICDRAGTVVGFQFDAGKTIHGVRNLARDVIKGDHFVLPGGAWSASLVST